ncbi:MAG TPA: hypothetical protein PKC96_01035 [Bacilli bacterium]|nr:hypothetical protein [Bacilli bacterium]
MDDLVRKVIELDKEGQAQISALEKEKDELSNVLKTMRKNLADRYAAETEKKEAAIEKKIKDDFLLRQKNIDIESKEKEKNIRDAYKKSNQDWLQQLVTYCLGK